MAKTSYECKVPYHRVVLTRADGSALVVEAGEAREPRSSEEAQLLAENPHLKQAERGAK